MFKGMKSESEACQGIRDNLRRRLIKSSNFTEPRKSQDILDSTMKSHVCLRKQNIVLESSISSLKYLRDFALCWCVFKVALPAHSAAGKGAVLSMTRAVCKSSQMEAVEDEWGWTDRWRIYQNLSRGQKENGVWTIEIYAAVDCRILYDFVPATRM